MAQAGQRQLLESCRPLSGDDHGLTERAEQEGGPARPSRQTPEQGVAPTIQVHPLLKVAEVASILNIGTRSVWRLSSRAKAGASGFPKPLRISQQIVRWRWQDVQNYLVELAKIGWSSGQRGGN